MNMLTEREELIELLDSERWKPIEADPSDDYSGGIAEQSNPSVADAILAAGYRKSRTITTVEELDALPTSTVVMDGTGEGVVYRKMHQAQDGVQWYEPGYALNWDSLEIKLPATVLYTPEATK